MSNWRSILAWESNDIKVGDKVRVIASRELLSTISLGFLRLQREGEIISVVDTISPENPFTFSDEEDVYQGVINTPVGFYPYSHWQDFLEVIRE